MKQYSPCQIYLCTFLTKINCLMVSSGLEWLLTTNTWNFHPWKGSTQFLSKMHTGCCTLAMLTVPRCILRAFSAPWVILTWFWLTGILGLETSAFQLEILCQQWTWSNCTTMAVKNWPRISIWIPVGVWQLLEVEMWHWTWFGSSSKPRKNFRVLLLGPFWTSNRELMCRR